MSLKSQLKMIGGLMLITMCSLSVIRVLTQPINPDVKQSQVPQSLSLKTWQPISSQEETSLISDASYDQLLEGKFYSFRQQTQQLAIHLGLFLNTDGDVVTLAKQLNQLKLTDEIQWEQSTEPTIGQVMLGKMADQNQILLTCINPNGLNTVSREQFSQNRIRYDFNLVQAMKWFIGRSQFLDKRCLLGVVVMSDPSAKKNGSQDIQSIWKEIQPQLKQVF